MSAEQHENGKEKSKRKSEKKQRRNKTKQKRKNNNIEALVNRLWQIRIVHVNFSTLLKR